MVKRICNYDDKDDSLIFIQENLKEVGLRISACTVANSDGKPNEDAYSVVEKDQNLWISVFDGTTSLKSISALKEISGARFASHFLKEEVVNILSETSIEPKDLLIRVNSLLLNQAILLGASLSDTHSLPASMVTIVKLDFKNKLLKFAHIGDTYGLTFNKDGSSRLFTDDKNNKFDQEMVMLMKKISTKKGVSIRETRQDEEYKKALYEMYIKRNNNPNGLGSGIVNGDPNAKLYIQDGEFSLENVESILVATDGLEIQGKSITDPIFQKDFFKILLADGLEGLVKRKKEAEDNDPDWNYARYKHSDDATGVYLTLLDCY